MFQMNNKNSVSQHGRDLAARLERDLGNDVGSSIAKATRVGLAHCDRTQSSS
jgi:hypothetical protein